MFRRKIEEIKMTSLLAQLEFLDALQNRHQIWINDVHNPAIAELHAEIISLIRDITGKYRKLLHLYQQDNKK